MDTAFVEKDFYNTPPAPDASPKVWEAWMAKEKRSRAAAKAQHTKSQEHNPDGFQAFFHDSGYPVKRDGVYRQDSAFVGFSGSKDEGTLSVDVGVADTQERDIALANMEAKRHTSGNKSRSKNARRRANKKAKLRLLQGGK